jgi:hypothetical protein
MALNNVKKFYDTDMRRLLEIDSGKFIYSATHYVLWKCGLQNKIFLIQKLIHNGEINDDFYSGISAYDTLRFQLIFCPTRIFNLIDNEKALRSAYDPVAKMIYFPIIIDENSYKKISILRKYCENYENFLDECIRVLNISNNIEIWKY